MDIECYFKCTQDGFFPDKTDCWVYHICDGGTHSVRACEEDLFFNPKTGLCDWPMNVDCKQAPTKKTTSSPKPKTITYKSKVSSNSTSSVVSETQIITDNIEHGPDTDTEQSLPPENNNICSNEDYGYMPHPKDCRKYIYCQEGTAKVFTCQGGLLWKQSDGNCVWPLDSDCKILSFRKLSSFFIINFILKINRPKYTIEKDNYEFESKQSK